MLEPDAWPHAASQETTPSPEATSFEGRRGRLFWLTLKTGFWTVLTLGLYRFWMKTRLRRWYWSAIRPGGSPLEYTGDPFEKLLGFLIAVVFLAFYIGIVNLLLMFLSFSLFQGNVAAYFLSFLGVIPLWFYAQYRSRRYVLARTRWRGVRFGLEPGAWGYAFRAMLYWVLTIISAGLLMPLMTFKLEKYKTDRTYFGASKMQQNGKWTGLYAAMAPLFAALFCAIGAAAAIFELADFSNPKVLSSLELLVGPEVVIAIGLSTVTFLLLFYGAFHYQVRSLQYLTEHKTLEDASLAIKPSPARIMFIHMGGYTLASLSILPLLIGLGFVAFAILSVASQTGMQMAGGLDWILNMQRELLVALNVGLYFTIFLLWSALTHAFVTMPVIRHYASRLRIENPEALLSVRQRPRDEFQEAEGFAEALDVGASI